uniref:Putative lipocalin-2 1 n=1 Tax=Ixodes ricinus TaxID=34613 RepID=V5HVH4_IXORI
MKVVSCSIVLYVLGALVDAQKPGETRIDEEKKYWTGQDIGKALNNSDRLSWLYYRTYSRDTENARHVCVYANVRRVVGPDEYEFEQGYKIINGQNDEKWVNETLFAKTFVIQPKQTYEVRTVHNAMKVSHKKDAESGNDYQLIYSDYMTCDVLRVLGMNGDRECELYLHNKGVKNGVPASCESLYKNACGRGDPRYTQQVYNESCSDHFPPETPEQENTKPTEPTTSTKEEPEGEPTPSTVPPGC